MSAAECKLENLECCGVQVAKTQLHVLVMDAGILWTLGSLSGQDRLLIYSIVDFHMVQFYRLTLKEGYLRLAHKLICSKTHQGVPETP